MIIYVYTKIFYTVYMFHFRDSRVGFDLFHCNVVDGLKNWNFFFRRFGFKNSFSLKNIFILVISCSVIS